MLGALSPSNRQVPSHLAIPSNIASACAETGASRYEILKWKGKIVTAENVRGDHGYTRSKHLEHKLAREAPRTQEAVKFVLPQGR